MIDLSFYFKESTDEEKTLFSEHSKVVKNLISNLSEGTQKVLDIRYFTGERWNTSGVAAVLVDGKKCTILDVVMTASVSSDLSDVYHFYDSLIYYLFNFANHVEWKKCDNIHHNEFLEIVKNFDGKIFGDGRIRNVYKAGISDEKNLTDKTDAANSLQEAIYFVEQRKKVFIKTVKREKKEKPLSLPRSQTGLPVDISDVQSWVTAELGRMEYIVLKKDKEEFCLFPSDYKQEDDAREIEKFWNSNEDEETCFTSKEIETVREWMHEQLKDENSTLSRYFAQRRIGGK